MRRLVLFRHAKSDWSAQGAKDHERQLARRGIVSAPLMAAWLHDEGITPDHILCSTAKRTRQTLDLALTQWAHKPHVHYDDRLYLSSPEKIIRMIKSVDQSVQTLMVIGHNPDLHQLTVDLVPSKQKTAATTQIGKFPTAAMAVFGFEIEEWSKIKPGTGTLDLFRKPKDLCQQA